MEGIRRRLWPAGRGLPFRLLAAAIVIVVGALVATGVAVAGLGELERAGERHADERARLVAEILAARIAKLPHEKREAVIRLAARRTKLELLVVAADGALRVDATLGGLDARAVESLARSERGAAESRAGRVRYRTSAVPEPGARDLVLALAPVTEGGGDTGTLLTALASLAALLIATSATIAHLIAHDATRDVRFITHRIDEMARVGSAPSGEPLPLRALDDTGWVTREFNDLVARFVEAEQAHRGALSRAEDADRDRAAFLAAVSHELRSPMNAILGFADLLIQEVDGPLSEEAREEVAQIRASGEHLSLLIQDILELSALESGQLRLTRSRTSVSALVGAVVREARVALAGRPVTLRLDAGSEVVAEIDERRMRQVVGNLVGNAVKFTAEGEVVVSVGTDGATCTIRVRDTGPGISDEERALVFDEFKQTRAERSRRRGTGLGLAIARRLVLLHGGTLDLESAVGRGSVFTVRLPLAPSRGREALGVGLAPLATARTP